jgi:hypothetical protein
MNLNNSLWIHNIKLLQENKCYNSISIIEVGRHPNRRYVISPHNEEYAGKFIKYIRENNYYHMPTELIFIKFNNLQNIIYDNPKKKYKFQEINCI